MFYTHFLREDTVVELKKHSKHIKIFLKILTFQICLEKNSFDREKCNLSNCKIQNLIQL